MECLRVSERERKFFYNVNIHSPLNPSPDLSDVDVMVTQVSFLSNSKLFLFLVSPVLREFPSPTPRFCLGLPK